MEVCLHAYQPTLCLHLKSLRAYECALMLMNLRECASVRINMHAADESTCMLTNQHILSAACLDHAHPTNYVIALVFMFMSVRVAIRVRP